MKHIKKFNENSHQIEITECMVGSSDTITETSVGYVIDGIEYTFTIRESGDISRGGEVDILPDGDLPFELTEELKSQMYNMYQDECI